MRALMTATVPSMIGQFNIDNINILIELGYEVDVACNFKDNSVWSNEKIELFRKRLRELHVQMYQIDFERTIFNVKNHTIAYKQIKSLMNEREYNLIHTHTPISSIITRIAFKNSNIFNKCKMIYTAHGFHFFKGNNPLKNILFRNIEKYGAKFTDILITINKEDYEAARNFKLRENGIVEYIPGVGIDIDKINSIRGNKDELCRELKIAYDSILLLSVGELNNNKNHKVVIQALSELPENIHYIVCGTGPLKEKHEQLAEKLNVKERLHLLGYRNDVIKIMKSCDIFVFPSKREGLSVALMEAMVCGLPCIASKIRGNVDLMYSYSNGNLFNKKNELIKLLLTNNKSNYSVISNIDNYSKRSITCSIMRIYERKK